MPVDGALKAQWQDSPKQQSCSTRTTQPQHHQNPKRMMRWDGIEWDSSPDTHANTAVLTSAHITPESRYIHIIQSYTHMTPLTLTIKMSPFLTNEMTTQNTHCQSTCTAMPPSIAMAAASSEVEFKFRITCGTATPSTAAPSDSLALLPSLLPDLVQYATRASNRHSSRAGHVTPHCRKAAHMLRASACGVGACKGHLHYNTHKHNPSTPHFQSNTRVQCIAKRHSSRAGHNTPHCCKPATHTASQQHALRASVYDVGTCKGHLHLNTNKHTI